MILMRSLGYIRDIEFVNNQKSLFLPIFKRERFDKSVADTYEQILDKQRIK